LHQVSEYLASHPSCKVTQTITHLDNLPDEMPDEIPDKNLEKAPKQIFHLFSQLPPDLRLAIWNIAWWERANNECNRRSVEVFARPSHHLPPAPKPRPHGRDVLFNSAYEFVYHQSNRMFFRMHPELSPPGTLTATLLQIHSEARTWLLDHYTGFNKSLALYGPIRSVEGLLVDRYHDIVILRFTNRIWNVCGMKTTKEFILAPGGRASVGCCSPSD
jgi:hypothetical protein